MDDDQGTVRTRIEVLIVEEEANMEKEQAREVGRGEQVVKLP